jgi:hypothetical protein
MKVMNSFPTHSVDGGERKRKQKKETASNLFDCNVENDFKKRIVYECVSKRDRKRRVKKKMYTVEHTTSFLSLFRLFYFTKEIRVII